MLFMGLWVLKKIFKIRRIRFPPRKEGWGGVKNIIALYFIFQKAPTLGEGREGDLSTALEVTRSVISRET